MARGLEKLSARFVSTVDRRGKYGDGGGLWLQVSAFETKSWLFRFMLDGRSREMGLGSVQNVSLKKARKKAEKCRELLADGIDPIEHRKVEKQREEVEKAKKKTFAECAELYIASHESSWKNEKHKKQWSSTLEKYAFPVIGDMDVAEISSRDVLNCIVPLWNEIPTTAFRLRGRIESILDYATVWEFRNGDNPARWRDFLQMALPAPTKVRPVKHHPAVHFDGMAEAMAALRSNASVSALALEFQILTGTRSGEVRGARWKEFDLENGVWTIPEERMKSGKVHRVPLSDAALDILDVLDIRDAFGGAARCRNRFVFPGRRKGKPLSNSALLKVMRDLGYEDETPHGFRSSLRDWISERTEYPNEVGEQVLAHAIPSKVEAAYRRGELFEKRTHVMADWADHCAGVKSKSKIMRLH